MLKVHICEDDREQLKRLESYIEDIIMVSAFLRCQAVPLPVQAHS